MLSKHGLVVALLALFLPVTIFAQEIQSVDEADLAYAAQIRSIADLLADYDHTSGSLLPTLLPHAGLQAFDAGRVITDFENDDMPLDFVKRIASKGIESSGVITYPVFVRLDPKTYDYLIEAYDGTPLLTVKHDKDYEPYWYIFSRFAERLEKDPSVFEELSAIHDPALIVGWYTLITPEGAQAFDAIAAALRELEDEGGDSMAMSAYGDDALRFTGMAYGIPGSNDVQMTIGYPSELRDVALDIVGNTNLMEWSWAVLLSTNTASDADSFSFSLPTVEHLRFLAAYRPDIDTDGDGIPDGVEIYLGPERTDPNDPHDPANAKGTLTYETYSGGQTGPIYVVAVTNIASWSTNISTVISEPGPYQITRIPHGDYWIKAWRDSNGDGLVGTYEATGIWYSAAITITGQVTGIDFTLTDPDTDGDGMGDWWEFLHFPNLSASPHEDNDGDKVSNLMEYYAGTDPTQGFQDSDGDGMSDDWETAHGLDRFNPADAQEDPDGDGFTNLAEYQHGDFGTDPHDRDSHPPYFEDVTATAFPGAGNLAPSQNAAWGDYDNDGDPDLYLASGVWRNDNGVFTNLPGTAFGPGLWLDANNNGYLDIFTWSAGSVTNWALYTNCLPAGVEGFAKDTSFPAPPIDGSTPGFVSRAACPVDVDADGLIDIYVGGYESREGVFTNRISYRDTLIRNQADISQYDVPWKTRYVDGADSTPHLEVYQFRTTRSANRPRRTRGITACDVNRDGAPDIHVSHYRNGMNGLWKSIGGFQFADAAERHNLKELGQTIGSVWGDLDNDGEFDLLSANLNHNPQHPTYNSQIYRNLGPDFGFAFSNVTQIVGLPWQEAYACPSFADVNRDGNLDIFITNADGGEYQGYGRLFRNDGNWSFTEITVDSGLPTALNTRSYQNAWADFDGDGTLDLFTGGRLYRNRTDAGNWIKLHLSGDGYLVNAAAIGAQVRIRLDDKTLTRQIAGAIGEGNQDAFTVHFGLGTNTGPVAVEILWPGHTVPVVSNLAVNQRHVLAFVTPDNDNFANAALLGANSGRLVARMGNASTEIGEPSHHPLYFTTLKSLWWRFEPESDGYLTLIGESSGLFASNSVLALYSGTSLNQLTRLAATQLGGYYYDSGLYEIPVSSGTVYHVAMALRSPGMVDDAMALIWRFRESGQTRLIMDTYTSDSANDFLTSTWLSAPVGETNVVPHVVRLSDIPNDYDKGSRIFWSVPGRPVMGQLLNSEGYELPEMGSWSPNTTGDVTVVDYHYEGNGNAAMLLRRESPGGPQFFFERGSHTSSGPDFWENVQTNLHLTNGYAASDYSAIQLARVIGTGAYRIIWNGAATNTQGTALMQTLNMSNTAIDNQTLITCGNVAANELVHYAWDPYPYIVLTWQTDATFTNTAVVERYDFSGISRTHSAAIVGKSNAEVYTTVPARYIPATGSQPAKLLWATAVLGKWEEATLQNLDISFNVTGTMDRYDYRRKGQRIPVDYIYNETGPTHRLIWRTSP